MSTVQRSQSAHSGQQSLQRPAPVPQAPQPIVRVMRLYKGGFHKSSVMTSLDSQECSDETTYAQDWDSVDFSISPYLLLPDNFGDIYIGDTFSAYVAVVNGHDDTTFTKVRMDLHLLVGDKTIELHDVRAPDPLSQNVQMS